MKLKKFIAPSLQEGKILITKELGEDAVIISTRSFPNTEKDNKIWVEIVASQSSDEIYTPQKEEDIIAERHDNKFQVNDLQITKSENSSDLVDIRMMLKEISDNMKYKFSGSLGDLYGGLYKLLLKAGYSESYALEITGKLSAEQKYTTSVQLLSAARELILKEIRFVQPINSSSKRIILAFVGPTGGGKTSTLIKIAIFNKLLLNANIILVSADTHKVGGSDQLQTLSSIAGIPFKAAYNSTDLKNIISDEVDRDFIFIDTTGRSHKNKKHIGEINEYLEPVKPDHIYFVGSATTETETFKESLKAFSNININSIIITKIDEAVSLGGIFEPLRKFYYPISYFSTGQTIPDDIEPAKYDYILNKVL